MRRVQTRIGHPDWMSESRDREGIHFFVVTPNSRINKATKMIEMSSESSASQVQACIDHPNRTPDAETMGTVP